MIAAVFAVFAQALSAEFVNWDDDKNFLANVRYRGLSLDHVEWMFTTFHMGPYQPLAWLTLGVDHALFGMDPRGYHATNIAWHAATVVLFFFLARTLFESARPAWNERARDVLAFVAAIAFGVHPLRVESVAWITERRDVVSGAFFVAAVLAWLLYARSTERRGRKYALALALFAFALFSKASVVTLPLALLVLDVWPLRRWDGARRRVILEKLPFLVLSAVFSIVAIIGQRSTGTALRALEDHGPERRIAQASYAALFHTWKSVWPTDLSPIYDMPSPFVASETRFVLAVAFVVATSAVMWFMRARIPAAAASWLAFLLLLAPVSGFISTGPQLVADRYSYLACMPFALLVAGGIGLVCEHGQMRVATVGATIALCTALALAARNQTRYWHDSTSLWERAYAVDPDSAVACDHLGVVRVTQSQAPHLDDETRKRLLEEAITLYTHAYEQAPHPNQVFNIGGAVMELAALDPATRTQELELAAQTMKQGLEFAAQTTGVQSNWRVMYATALVELRRYDEARADLELVLRAEPDHVNALRWSARIAFEENRPEEGLALLRRTTEIDPENAASWTILANSLRSLGRAAEADAAGERARGAAPRGGR